MLPLIHPKQLLLSLSVFLLSSCGTPAVGTTKLFIPPLIDGRNTVPLPITISETHHEFFAGTPSPTMSFSAANAPQSYLGPTIRLQRGKNTTIRFINQLSEGTTVHGHGLHVRGELDGGPQGLIAPNTSWQITIPVAQVAGTSWYHPHAMGKTAEHVHAGLAGLYIIEDEVSAKLPIPKRYGIDDLPLIIQDRSFVNGKLVPYRPTMEQHMGGLREATLVVNGTLTPVHSVPAGWIRLRLLNGANARSFAFFFKNNRPFQLIATDGGFIEKPVELKRLTLMPGERAEIMVDLSTTTGSVPLMAAFLNEEAAGFFPLLTKQLVVELRVDPAQRAEGMLPKQLTSINWVDRTVAQTTRTFSLEMGDGGGDGDGGGGENAAAGAINLLTLFSINGVFMDMDVINERVRLGEWELWRVQGEEMAHPFHVHGTSFQVLSANGAPPPPEQRGWKDTIIVNDGWTEFLVQFNFPADRQYPYMYHCHILEHEDGGMMGQFTVE